MSIDVHDGVQPFPVIFKRTAAWQGMRLEHYRLGQGLIPEHRHNEHLIIISLSLCRGELRMADGLKFGQNSVPDSVCVIPSGHSFHGSVDAGSEILSLFLYSGL